jgi:hypothetical protein
MVDFKDLPDSKLNEQAANFDIVIGTTPEDSEPGFGGGRPAPPPRRQ